METTTLAPDLAALGLRFRALTVAQYHALAEAGLFHEDDRVELLDGHLIAMSPVGGPHLTVVNRLSRWLTLHAGAAVVSVQNPLRLNDRSEPEPDVVLLRPGSDDGRVPTAADALLVVEVSDRTLGYDRGVKRDRYARAGVPEVWVVGVEGRFVEVARGPEADGAYGEVRRVGLDGAVSVAALLEAPALPVADLFAGW